MIVLRNLIEIKTFIKAQKKLDEKIGFIPTMGALHLGHLSLVKTAKKENNIAIVSIFVNPTQFNNKEDLKKYPRTEDADLALLKTVNCDAVYLPTTQDIYPNGENIKNYNFGGLEKVMEGEFRPGHFNGVATVVKRFFEIIQPNKAYFGEKDFQQLRIIQAMVKQENLPITIIPMPIMREKNGLAMSSRNQRLTNEFLTEAPKIYQILKKAKEWLRDCSIEEVKHRVKEEFSKTKLKLEYFQIAESNNLQPTTKKNNTKLHAFVAAFAGEIRLIDNIALN